MKRGLLKSVSAVFTLCVIVLMQLAPPRSASAQFSGWKEKATSLILCGGGAYGGYKLGEKLSDFETKRLKLSPAAAAAMKKQFEIGLAMSFCNGGKLVANTTFAKLTKKDRDARQSELDEAVASEQPVTKNVALPDHPGMTETLTAGAAETEGSNECKLIKDHVAEGSNGDDALVKYCRKPPDGKYSLAMGV